MKKNLILSRNFFIWILFPLVVVTLQNVAQAQTFTDTTFNNSDWTEAKITSLSAAGSTFTASQDTVSGNPAQSRKTIHTYPTGDIHVYHLSNSSTYDPVSQGAIVSLSYNYDLIHYTTGAVAYYLLVFQNNTYYVSAQNLATGNSWQSFGSSNLTAASFVDIANATSNAHPDFSCKGSRIVFGYLTRNHNPIANSTATTSSGLDNWKVTIDKKRPCCGTISETRVTCNKGVFTYTFTVTNNSSQVMQYLLLSPPAGATFSISPNVINFGANPLNPGQSTNVSVTITNASPGDHICINVALADENVVTCCTIQTCIDLPDCPCLRIVDTSFSCGANGSFTYAVVFQNLTSVPIQQIFIVPTQPSNLNISPQLVTLSTPLQPQQQTTITITVNGVPPGTHICLRLSPVGDDAATCCSIERCFTSPTCPP